SYTNIGNAYLFLGDTTQPLNYYNKGIEIAEEQNLPRELSTLYNNLGSVFKGQKKCDEAIENYNKSLSLRTALNDDYGIASAAITIGSLYISKGEIGRSHV